MTGHLCPRIPLRPVVTVIGGRIVTPQSAITSCAMMKTHPRNMKGLGHRPRPTTDTIVIAFTMPLNPRKPRETMKYAMVGSVVARPVHECPSSGDGPSTPAYCHKCTGVIVRHPPPGQGWSGPNRHISLSMYLVCVVMGKRHGRSSGMRHAWRSSSGLPGSSVRPAAHQWSPPPPPSAAPPLSVPPVDRWRVSSLYFSYQLLSTSVAQKRNCKHNTPAAVPSVTGTAGRWNCICSSYSSFSLVCSGFEPGSQPAAAGRIAVATRRRKIRLGHRPTFHCTSESAAAAYTEHP